MADQELNYIIRILFPDNKLPPLDTKQPEESIARVRAMWQQLRSEMAGGLSVGTVPTSSVITPSAPSGGGVTPPRGYPVPAAPRAMPAPPTMPTAPGPAPTPNGYGFRPGQQPPFILAPGGPYYPGTRDYDRFAGTSTYDPRAGATFATRPQYGPWNSSWGGNYGPQGSGGFSQGPIRDPGSWAPSSMQTGRGYDQAMLRQRVATANQYYAAADEAGGSINKAAIGINQLSGALTNLAAGIILTNKAAEAGADSWQNFQTRFVGGMNIAVGSAMALRGAQNLATGAGGLALGGVNMAAGMSSMMGMSGMAGMFGRMGAPLGMAGMAAGGVVVGAGAAVGGYLGYQLYQANQQNDAALQRGQELEVERVNTRNRMLFNSFGRAEHNARFSFGLNSEYSRALYVAGATNFRDYDRSLTSGISSLLGRNEGLRGRMTLNASEESLGANTEIARNLEMAISKVQERGLGREGNLRDRFTTIQEDSSRNTDQFLRARALQRDMRGTTDREWNRGLSAIRDAQQNGLNERNAMRIAGTAGMGGVANEWLDRRNQARIDALPPEFRDENAKSSTEMQSLKAQLKKSESEQKELMNAIRENATATATLVRDLKAGLEKTNQDVWKMKGDMMQISTQSTGRISN